MTRGRPRAFTLVEVMLVLAIIAVLAGIAVPRFSSALYRHRVNQAVYRLAADLDRARAEARAGSSTRRVTFDKVNHTYRITGIRDLNTTAIGHEVDLAAEPYRCKIQDVWITSGNAYIEFNGYGAVDSNCVVRVYCGDYQRDVSVNIDGGGAQVP